MELFVKLSGMRKKEWIREEAKSLEKKRGKEDKKYPTRPQVIFYSYRVRKSSGKDKYFPPVLICSTRSYTVLPLLGGNKHNLLLPLWAQAQIKLIRRRTYNVRIKVKYYRYSHCWHIPRDLITGLRRDISKNPFVKRNGFAERPCLIWQVNRFLIAPLVAS